MSYFQKDEKVFYSPSDQRGMFGPYTVVKHDGNEMYTIRKDSDGQVHPSQVSKSELSRV